MPPLVSESIAWLAKRRFLLPALLVLRVLNSLVVRTFFNPDEYWQGPEVAHHMVWGVGHLTWEWMPDARLRCYLHPLLFGLLFYALKILNLDSRWAIAYGPSLVQGVLTAVGDWYVFRLSLRLTRNLQIATWALVLQLCSWFNFYCLVRTYSSSLETVLQVISLYYWCSISSAPKRQKSEDEEIKVERRELPDRATSSEERAALFIGALSCVVRPTSATVWLYLGLQRLYYTKHPQRYLLCEVLLWAGLPIMAGMTIDRFFYGEWTIVQWNFLRFNLLESKSALYGTHPWHWNFTAGFPAILGSYLPLFLLALHQRTPRPAHSLLAPVILIHLVSQSLSPHKEFRFLLPALPLALILSACTIPTLKWLRPSVLFGIIILTNLPHALYLSTVHQRAPIDVCDYLAAKISSEPFRASVHFLTSCHATPYHSYLHTPLPPRLRFLDCSPTARLSIEGSETDRFINDPGGFASQLYNNEALPDFIVIFGSSFSPLASFFNTSGYIREAAFFYSSFKGDMDSRNLEDSMIIYRKEHT